MHPTRKLEVAVLSVIGVVILSPVVGFAFFMWTISSFHEVHTSERRVASPDGKHEILLRNVASGGFGPSEFATHVFVLAKGGPAPDGTSDAVVSLADAWIDGAYTARVRWRGNDVIEARVDDADFVLRHRKELRTSRRAIEVIFIRGAER